MTLLKKHCCVFCRPVKGVVTEAVVWLMCCHQIAHCKFHSYPANCQDIMLHMTEYTLCLMKKASPTFLAVTPVRVTGYTESRQLKDGILYQLGRLIFLQYLATRKLHLFTYRANVVCYFANKCKYYRQILFIKRSTVCTKPDKWQDRAQSIQLSDMHTVSIHHVCHDTKSHVRYGNLF